MDDQDVLKRADDIACKLKSHTSDKYEKAARVLAGANAVLLVTLIWKSFEISGGLPFFARIAMIFFLLGIAAITCRYILDYLAEGLDRRPIFDEAITFFDKNKEVIQRNRPDEYKSWDFISRVNKPLDLWLLKMAKGNTPSHELLMCSYMAADFLCLLVSGASLTVGGLILFAAALFRG